MLYPFELQNYGIRPFTILYSIIHLQDEQPLIIMDYVFLFLYKNLFIF